MFRLCDKRGQNTLEYALLIGVIVAALIAMQTYLKKGVQGRLKESTDNIGKQFDPGTFTDSWQTTGSGNTVSSEARKEGVTTSTISSSEVTTRSESDSWGTAP